MTLRVVPASDAGTLATLTDPGAFPIGRTGVLRSDGDGILDWRL